MRKSVAVCETQPVTAEGLRSVLGASPDLEFLHASNSISSALETVHLSRPALLILDKAFGAQAVLDTLVGLKTTDHPVAAVVWGVSITEAEALRFVQAGARGVVRKSADVETLLVCLRSVASGATWMESTVFHEQRLAQRDSRTGLTPREQQVMELVGQGLKNREVARELGIRPGTVKVHLKHIFEKTGVQGRYSLALVGLTAAPESSRSLAMSNAG
jgi:two-component system, NarL family, nitrate/nitrite response regulator NarL